MSSDKVPYQGVLLLFWRGRLRGVHCKLVFVEQASTAPQMTHLASKMDVYYLLWGLQCARVIFVQVAFDEQAVSGVKLSNGVRGT